MLQVSGMNRGPLLVLLGLLTATVSCDEPLLEAPLDEDLELELVADTMFVIGGLGTEEANSLSRVASLGFDGRGRLHVFDNDQYRVTTWDEKGALVQGFGRRGQGPGEFEVPRYSYTLRDGRVVIYDIGHSALLVFGSDGRHERNVRMSPDGGKPVPGERSVYAGDRLVGPDDYWMTRPVTEESRTPVFAYSFTADSVVVAPYHMAWAPPSSHDGLAMLPTIRLGGFSDGGAAVVDSVDYRINILSRTGEVMNVIRRPITPLPVTELAMEAERQRRRAESSASSIAQGLREMTAVLGISIREPDAAQIADDYFDTLEDLQFASEMPAIRKIGVDWDDRMWITRSNAVGEDGPIDLMEADGRYFGTLLDNPSPDAFGPDGLLAYVTEDELGVPSVVVVRIISIALPMENPPPTSDRRTQR